ncbi:MAG: CinA family protein [Candidatus Omnitrophica bacterium]|nr:CinA family protein [Candidatus Omnitrophota bacterium]
MKIESKVWEVLRKRQITLAVAESCTGGLISSRITDISGSSKYFKMGLVAYSNLIKENILGVSFRHCEQPKGVVSSVIARRPKADEAPRLSSGLRPELLPKDEAISKQVALTMAEGVRRLAGTDIGVGVTGIAGPTGGTKKKPVGLVYIALVTNKKRIVKEFRFKGSRLQIKSRTTQAALRLILQTVMPAKAGIQNI